MSLMPAASTNFAPRSAMLVTLRNVAGLSQQDAADVLDTSVQQLRRWESGSKTPPPGVLDDMHDLLADMKRFADLEMQDHLPGHPQHHAGATDSPAGAAPLALLRYRDAVDRDIEHLQDDQRSVSPDRGLDLPIVSQAIATWHAAQQLEQAGHTVCIIWFDAREYGQWLGDRPDTMAARKQWAHEQVVDGAPW